MRNQPFRTLLVATLLAASSTPALAQVTTSSSALDALGPSKRAQPAHHPAAHARPHATSHTQTRRTAGHAAAPGPANAPAATIPKAPPPAPVFTAPVINVPLHPPAPPPPVPVVQTAIGVATPLPDDGVRITFGPSSSDVNPVTMQALHDFAARVKAAPEARAVLDAAAAGSPDDPSTPRRLALSRGLAARAVLINDGIASTRIYVRMDPTAAAGTNRVDLHLQSNPDTAPAASPAAPASPAASSPAPSSPAPSSPAQAAAPGPSQP